MDKNQAEAAARAILEPELQAQREYQAHRREAEEKAESQQRNRRIAAWFLLAGAAIGVAVVHYTGQRLAQGIAWGGIAGGVVGWTVAFIKGRTAAP